MEAEQIRKDYDWSNTLPDMRDRVIRAIANQWSDIVACTGEPTPQSVITWYDNGYIAPLFSGNFAFRLPGEPEQLGESLVATPHKRG